MSRIKKFLYIFSLVQILIFNTLLPVSVSANNPTVETIGLRDYSRTFAFPADLISMSDKSLLVLDRDNYTIYKLSNESLSVFATFKRNYPSYLTGDEPCAMDSNRSGEIFIVNCSQTVLYRYSNTGTLLKTITIPKLGVVDRGFDWGGGLAVDSNSSVYLSDEKNFQILKINVATEVTEVYAGRMGMSGQNNGARLQSTFNLPRGLAIDNKDSLYVADVTSGRIRRIDTEGQVSTLNADICLPTGLDSDSQGNLIVVSEHYCGSKITKLTLNGLATKILDDSAESVGSVPFALVSKPTIGAGANIGIEVVPSSNGLEDIYVVADDKNGNLKFINQNGIVVRIFGGPDVFGVNRYSNQSPLFNHPNSIFSLSDGNLLVTDNGTLRLVNPEGSVLKFMNLPWGCAGTSTLLSDGTLMCSQGSYIAVRNPDGILSKIGSESKGLVDGDSLKARFDCVGKMSFYNNQILAADSCNHAIRTIRKSASSDNYQIGTLASGISLQRQDFTVSRSMATFSWPSEVATSKDGSVYIAEGGHDRLRRLDLAGDGNVSVIGGNFRSWPTAIVVDGKERVLIATERGYLYEVKNNSLSKIGGDGPGIKVAPLSSSLFYIPKGMAIDVKGDLLIADSSNHVIRRVSGLDLTPNQIYDVKSLDKLISSMKSTTVSSSNTQSTNSPNTSVPNTIPTSKPQPKSPTFSSVNFVDNKINIVVNIGSNSSERPENVYLVAPKLGIDSTQPAAGSISGSNASWSIKLNDAILGTGIPLAIFSEKDGISSTILTGTFSAPAKSNSIKTISAPLKPSNFRSRIAGSSVLVQVDISVKPGFLPTKAFLFSNSLGLPKNRAVLGEIVSNQALIEVPLKASMAGKKYLVTVFLSNSKGESKPLNATLAIPGSPKGLVAPTVIPIPRTVLKTVICYRSNQTRTFEGDICPPGWEKR